MSEREVLDERESWSAGRPTSPDPHRRRVAEQDSSADRLPDESGSPAGRPMGGTARSPARLGVVFLVFVVAVVVIGAVLGRGRGYKTRIMESLGLAPAQRPAPPSDPSVAEGTPDPAIRFERVALPVSAGVAYTSLQVGPDHRLYAGADDGRILRFDINPDGTLGEPQTLSGLQSAEGGKRLLTGFCFDPASTPQQPIVWASHGFHAFHDAPDFTGTISRLSGPDLQTVEDAVIHLPRSSRDHLNNQPCFGPDGALYFPQGSNSASGAADPDWGHRPERLLSASILRLDVRRITPGRPLDALTPDAGGSYDPFAPNAPLTIYAGGLRNVYSLIWTREGRLYAPVNGSNPGGATPAGPGAPALTDLPIDEDDWLDLIIPGKYYGHPNPQQHHYVLNGGNPGGAAGGRSIVPLYPAGTRPDPDWQPPVFDFGAHVSPDGAIQYRGNAFNGRLDGKLLVCRFNVGRDLICLGLDAAGHVNSVQTQMSGARFFESALDLAEDVRSGNIYVAEYGGKRITLLRVGPS